MDSKNKVQRGNEFSGKAPIKMEVMEKYNKGDGVNVSCRSSKIKNRVQRLKFKSKEKFIKKTTEHAARTEVLMTENYGAIECDEYEHTIALKQRDIVKNVDITSATKRFDLSLKYGPYSMRYTRDGRNLVIGGLKGHVAAFDWVTKKLNCEINVMESVHDISWLHNETMFAVAQKSWVYIYDNQGIELHCLQKIDNVTRLEFLPYHFLLASSSNRGNLSWLDVSVGKIVSQYNAKSGGIYIMKQNPYNAVLCTGNSKGVVSMWSPNMRQPLAKMLCHKQGILDLAIHPYGTYMATSCVDRTMKVWDVRQLSGPLHNNILHTAAQCLSYSQRGMLSLGMENVVEIYRESNNELNKYLVHKGTGKVRRMQFCPYEDVLGTATSNGFASILVPGSGEANFDALEANPFQTKKQRQENEVKALLEKIQPELITLDPSIIAEVDVPSLKDTIEAKKQLLHLRPKVVDFKPRRTKSKGKGGTAKIIKTKKILHEIKRKETIELVTKAKNDLGLGKEEKTQKNYGALNRFLPKK